MITEDKGVDLVRLIWKAISVIDAVVCAICLAPSGGNVQPWRIHVRRDGTIAVYLVRERTSLMDVALRGSLVAIGATMVNATITASHYWHRPEIEVFPEGPNSDLVFTIKLVGGATRSYRPGLYPAMINRVTNRRIGVVRPFTPASIRSFKDLVADEGAQLHFVTDRAAVGELADILAESDRLRYLTPGLYRQMMAELPPEGPVGFRIDPDTFEFDLTDQGALRLIRDPLVMEFFRELDRQMDVPIGVKLGDSTRDRVNASSAVAVITVQGDTPADYLRGGRALERAWIDWNDLGFDIHPSSPVFLYARCERELQEQSPEYWRELSKLQQRFNQVVGLESTDAPILVLRVSHPDPKNKDREVPRSRRLSSKWVVTSDVGAPSS